MLAANTGTNATFGNLQPEAMAVNSNLNGAELESVKQELMTCHEQVQRTSEKVLKIPGVSAFVGANESLANYFKKTESGSQFVTLRLTGTFEVITHLQRQLQQRVQECNQMSQEFKTMES